MFGFFGIKAFLIVFGAIIIALISGYILIFLGERGLIEKNPNTAISPEDFSVINDLFERRKGIKVNSMTISRSVRSIWKGSVSLADMVLWWIMLGIFLASFAAAYLPAGFMHQYMGATILGLAATLFLATIIEVCSEGFAPLAFEIYRQTAALGNSFVFLMAGVVTDYTEIGLIWTNIGWKTAVWLPIVAVPQVLILGLIYNIMF